MKQRILVIDDDELVRTGISANLAREGFAVRMAEGGEQGLAEIRREMVDLVLCDLVLGDMDGIDVLRRIKSEWPDIAVVMITGHATIRNALDALRSGASDYIAKPADPDEVVHRLRTVLDSEHLRRTLAAERARTEARRRETQEHLARSERMASLGMLARGAAEDLSQMIHPVREHASALRELLPADHPAQELVRAIEEAGGGAASILQDLKAIGPGTTFAKELLSLNSLVDACLFSEEFNRLKSAVVKVRVDVHLDPTLPGIYGSREALSRSIGNLLARALESVATGGLIHVETLSEKLEHAVGRYGSGSAGEYVVLRIRDSGPPLSPENLERLFEPFYNRQIMGHHLVSGLGLALVHRVVTDHGGFIDVRNSVGKGNTCDIYFPLASETDTLELKPDYTGAERVLIVDDYEEHRRAAADILIDLGYHVLTAANGREAVRLFDASMQQDSQRIDLVVIDLILGDEFDGVETYKRILELKPGQPAILVSGFADIARIVEARKLGIRNSIQKPYAADTLGAAVRSALDS